MTLGERGGGGGGYRRKGKKKFKIRATFNSGGWKKKGCIQYTLPRKKKRVPFRNAAQTEEQGINLTKKKGGKKGGKDSCVGTAEKTQKKKFESRRYLSEKGKRE